MAGAISVSEADDKGIEKRAILYVTDRISVRGGADQHLLQIIRWAASKGFDVTIAAGSGVPADGEAQALLPVCRAIRVKGLGKPVVSNSGLDVLRELIEKADVVHLQNVMNPRAIELAVSSGRALVTIQDHRVFCPGMGKTHPHPEVGRCRSVMSADVCARCLPDEEYLRRTFELTEARRRALQGARLIVLSHYMTDELEAVGLPGAEVIPPWIDVNESTDLDPGEGFVVGGRLVKHKGIENALEAWRGSGTNHPLIVAGSGPLESELEGARMLGWLPVDELRALLRRSRALLFPSFWQEPFGILAVQALAEGTPVIVSESGGTVEWSRQGCLRVPTDEETMAEAISSLASDPALVESLGLAGRSYVARKFDRHSIETRLLELYKGN